MLLPKKKTFPYPYRFDVELIVDANGNANLTINDLPFQKTVSLEGTLETSYLDYKGNIYNFDFRGHLNSNEENIPYRDFFYMFAYVDGTVDKKINYWNQIIWSIKSYNSTGKILCFSRDTIKSLYNVQQYTDKYKPNCFIPVYDLQSDTVVCYLAPISICAFTVTNNLIINFAHKLEL